MAFHLFKKKRHFYLRFEYESIKCYYESFQDLRKRRIKTQAELIAAAQKKGQSLFDYFDSKYSDPEWKVTNLVELRICKKTKENVLDEDWESCKAYHQDDIKGIISMITRPEDDYVTVYQNILPMYHYFEVVTYEDEVKASDIVMISNECGWFRVVDDSGNAIEVKEVVIHNYDTDDDESTTYDGECIGYWGEEEIKA